MGKKIKQKKFHPGQSSGQKPVQMDYGFNKHTNSFSWLQVFSDKLWQLLDRYNFSSYGRPVIIGSIFLYLFLYPFLKMSNVSFPLTYQYFYLIYFACGLAILGAALLSSKKYTLLNNGVAWISFTFLLVKIISGFTGMLPYKMWFGSYGIWSDSVIYWWAVLMVLIALLIIKPTRKETSLLIHLLFIQAFILSASTLKEAIGQNAFVEVTRPRSSLFNANYFIAYIILLWPTILILLIKQIQVVINVWSDSLSLWRDRILKSLFVFAYLLGLIYFSLGILVCLPEPMQRALMPWLNAPADTYVAQAVQQASTGTKGFLSDPSNAERFVQWKLGYDIGLKHPIFGSGPGTTRAGFYQEVNNLPNWDYNVAMDHPHNDLIEQFSQNGIVGLIVYLGLWIYIFASFIKNRKSIKSENRPLAWGMFFGLLLYFIFNQLNFTVVHTGLVYWTIIGLMIVLTNEGRVERLPRRFAPRRDILITLLLVTSIPVLYWTIRLQAGEAYAVKAVYASSKNQYVDSATYSQKAALTFPLEENYFRLAGANNMLSAVFSKSLTDSSRADAKKQAVDLSKKAIDLNSYVPENIVSYGLAKYVVSDSEAEKIQGADTMEKGIKMIKYNIKNYKTAVDAYSYTGSFELAKTRAEHLLDIAPNELKDAVKIEIQRFYTQRKTTDQATQTTK